MEHGAGARNQNVLKSPSAGEPRRGSGPKPLTKPVYLLLLLVVSIFVADLMAALILADIGGPLPLYKTSFFDAVLLVTITFPILYFAVLRPMQLHVSEFRRIEGALRESENFLQAIIETAPECIKLVSSDGTIVTMNQAGLEMIQVESVEEIKGKPVSRIIDRSHREAFSRLTRNVFEGQAGVLQFEIVGARGRRLWLETHAVPLRNEQGQVAYLLGITHDITEKRRAEQALRESEEKYRSVVESTDDFIYVVDERYRYVYINKQDIAGRTPKDYVGHSYSEFHEPEETESFKKDIDSVFLTGKSRQHEHKSLEDGRYYAQTLSPVRGPEGRVVAVTVISKDITERKIVEEKLRAMSLTDELTGLYNRRGFFAFCDQLLKLCRRRKMGAFLLYADLDNLKEINDLFGHIEGDRTLVETALVLKETFRESDIIARVGGDEFVVIPVGRTREDLDAITGRLLQNIEAHNGEKERKFRLSISFGTSFYDPQSPVTIEELIAGAEEMMYARKKNKRTSL